MIVKTLFHCGMTFLIALTLLAVAVTSSSSAMAYPYLSDVSGVYQPGNYIYGSSLGNIGYSNIGYGSIGNSNIGYSNIGYSNIGYSNIGNGGLCCGGGMSPGYQVMPADGTHKPVMEKPVMHKPGMHHGIGEYRQYYEIGYWTGRGLSDGILDSLNRTSLGPFIQAPGMNRTMPPGGMMPPGNQTMPVARMM